MKKTIRKILIAIFIFSIIITVPGVYSADTYAGEKKQEVVKVGVYNMTGFHYYDKMGELQGYCIDYLELLSGFTGWKFEYVEVEDFSDGLKKLANKEIDLLSPAMYTTQRDAMYDYSAYSFGTEYTVLVTDIDNQEVFYEDYGKFQDMKIAVLTDYPLTGYFKEYMQRHNFEAELVYYDSIDDSKEAMKLCSI